MARAASATLVTRIRDLNTELRSLDAALKDYGDREAAEAVRRARRELETVERQGLFKSRGQVV